MELQERRGIEAKPGGLELLLGLPSGVTRLSLSTSNIPAEQATRPQLLRSTKQMGISDRWKAEESNADSTERLGLLADRIFGITLGSNITTSSFTLFSSLFCSTFLANRALFAKTEDAILFLCVDDQNISIGYVQEIADPTTKVREIATNWGRSVNATELEGKVILRGGVLGSDRVTAPAVE